jgi:hypothetical protein
LAGEENLLDFSHSSIVESNLDRNKSNTVRPYAHAPKYDDAYIVASAAIITMVMALEKAMWNLLSRADLRLIEYFKMFHGWREIMFDKLNGIYSQMALTRKYWSPWHTDDDAVIRLLFAVCVLRITCQKE